MHLPVLSSLLHPVFLSPPDCKTTLCNKRRAQVSELKEGRKFFVSNLFQNQHLFLQTFCNVCRNIQLEVKICTVTSLVVASRRWCFTTVQSGTCTHGHLCLYVHLQLYTVCIYLYICIDVYNVRSQDSSGWKAVWEVSSPNFCSEQDQL